MLKAAIRGKLEHESVATLSQSTGACALGTFISWFSYTILPYRHSTKYTRRWSLRQSQHSKSHPIGQQKLQLLARLSRPMTDNSSFFPPCAGISITTALPRTTPSPSMISSSTTEPTSPSRYTSLSRAPSLTSRPSARCTVSNFYVFSAS